MSADSSTEWWRPPQAARPVGREARGEGRYDLSFWALVAFTTILLLAPQERFPFLAPLRIALLSVAVALVACGYRRLSRRLPLLEFSPDVILLFAIAFWALLTLPFSVWPGGSMGVLTDAFLKAVICFLLLSHAVMNLRQLRGMCWCLVLCTVPLGLTTLGNYLSGTTLGSGAARVAGYSSGLTENPNDMALMLNLILPLSIALMLGAKSGPRKLVLGGIAGLIVIAVIVTFSRAGFLTLLFIGACYAWLLRNRPQRILIPVVLVMGLFALPLVPDSYYERIGTILNVEEDQTNSAQTRLSDMKVAADMALSKPLTGSGIGMSVLAMNDARGATWTDVHNVYLQLAVDLGFPGLLLFLLFLFSCLRITGDIVGRPGLEPVSRDMVYLGEALRVSLLAFAVSAMFYPVAYNFYFYFFAGLAVAAGRIARGEIREPAA